MSFNVRGSFHDARKKNAWRNRAGLNVATIRRYAPDVIGLQEAQRGNLNAYRKRLPRYARVRGPKYGNGIPHDHNTILYDPERLDLLDSGGFWLSETPEKHSKSWNTRVARSATWALLRTSTTGLYILHMNTHLDHVSALARREGSKLVVAKGSEVSDRSGVNPAIVLTGDFNARPGSATHKNLTGAGYVDTYLAAGNKEDSNTFHAFRGAGYRDPHPKRGPRRIDWILLKDPNRRLRTSSHEIILDADEDSGLFPSDHYPVMAAFQQVSISASQEPLETEQNRQEIARKVKEGSPDQGFPPHSGHQRGPSAKTT
jgi:endonuclease/exonuclease/phosphatase family metal-dependent hydrolase